MICCFLLDRNERPEYLSLTRSSIREDARIGSVVGELQSRDPDLDRSPLTFQVKSPANSPFAIGGTGNRFLVTRYKLDYETIQKIEILISVTDNGGLSLEKYFNITIIGKFLLRMKVLMVVNTSCLRSCVR